MLKIKETLNEASLGYKQKDELYFASLPNKYYFLIALLLGLGLVFIGDLFYILPLVGYGLKSGIELGSEAYNAFYYDYIGFITLTSKIAATVLIFIGIKKILKKDLIKTKNNVLYNIILVIIGMAIIAGISFLFDYLNKIIPGFKEAVNEQAVNSILDGKSRIPYAICIVTLTPFVEEVVFRKLTFSLFKELNLPRWATILITASIFALIHCTSEDITTWVCYWNFLQYFLLSMVITLVYAFTNENVYASTGLHILNNLMGLILYFM